MSDREARRLLLIEQAMHEIDGLAKALILIGRPALARAISRDIIAPLQEAARP
jgi:hypothetical protein